MQQRKNSVSPFNISVINGDQPDDGLQPVLRVKKSQRMVGHLRPEAQQRAVAALWGALYPLSLSMRLFGLYFDRDDNGEDDDNNEDIYKHAGVDDNVIVPIAHVNKPQEKNKKMKKNKNTWRHHCFGSWPKIYSFLILVFIWANFLRTFTIYLKTDTALLTIIFKSVWVVYTAICTLIFTTFYRSSYVGKLHQTLNDIIAADCTDFTRCRLHVALYTAVAWMFSAANCAFVLYILFFSNMADLQLCPLYTYITDGITDGVVMFTKVFQSNPLLIFKFILLTISQICNYHMITFA